jgi:adenine deaminase
MNIDELKKIIDVANKRIVADLVIKNGKIIDVYQSKIIEGNIAIFGKYIVGIGDYKGKTEIDVCGAYISPGFIDAHMHIESTYLSPEEAGRLLVPKGTTTIIADPHEIVNVCGLEGLDYMMQASEGTALDIKYMLPSCVPCTSFETSGAIVCADDMKEPLKNNNILGIGEFMNYVGINNCDEEALAKLYESKLVRKIVDGHAPGLSGFRLDGYIASGIHTDHECSTVEEMHDRISRGIYVLLRQGSACNDLRNLLKGVTRDNVRYCALCSDDREPKTIIESGHMDDHLRICVQEGIDPFMAVRMATINAAECYRLYDRGGIAPGLLANIVVFDNLTDFTVQKVIIEGKIIAENGEYLKKINRYDISSVSSSVKIKSISKDSFKLKLNSDETYAIKVINGGILTKKEKIVINRNNHNEVVLNNHSDVNKIAVVERHHETGNVGIGLIKGFGINEGAIAQTVAHDSHNVVVVGMSDEDMTLAVEKLIEIGGGIVIVKNGKVLSKLELPIAGLMSDKTGDVVKDSFTDLHKVCHEELGIKVDEPVMLLSFMSLPVVPEIKITDKGVFDVTCFEFL